MDSSGGEAEFGPPGGWPDHAAALPGPDTLTAIRDADPARLSPAQLVDAINCSERLMSHLAGLQTTLLTEFARPGRSGDITRIVAAFSDFDGQARHTDGTLDTDLLHTLVADHAHGMAAAEIAAALHISPITARHRVDKAIDLHDGLPATLQALTAGRIDRGRAAMITEHTAILEDPELRAAVEEKILPLAETRTAGRLRPLVDRAVIIADPDAAERRVKKARRGREVTHRPDKDDMSIIRAALPADGAVTVYTLIDLIAASTKIPGDERGIGERRADALTDIAHQLLSHGHLDLRGLLHNPDDEDSDENGDDWTDGGYHHANPEINDPDDDYDRSDRDSAWQHINEWDTSIDLGDRQHPPRTTGTSTTPAGQPVHEPVNPQSPPQGPNPAEAEHDDSSGTDLPAAVPSESSERADKREAADTGADIPDTDTPDTDILDADASGSDRASSTPSSGSRSPTSSPPPIGSNRILSRQGRRPHLALTMSMSTLMALDRLPGHLDGYGAITAELARAIAAAAASLSLVIIDPETGSPLHAGERHTYRPRQQQRDVTTTLFDACRFPSCRQPSWRCDLDHRQSFNHQHPEAGGQTCEDNLDPYCRRHHLLKHHSDWTPSRDADGTLQWRSPTRHTYSDPPRELTLPGELIHPEPLPRSGIGLADLEHHEQCAEPAEPDEPTPMEFRVKQAINYQDQLRVRGRLEYLKKVIAMPPKSPREDSEASWIDCHIQSRAEAMRKEFEATYGALTPCAATLPDDARPPF